MIQFKYNDVTVSMNEDTGKFTMEGNIAEFSWQEIKRTIDNAAKVKYATFKAVLYGSWRGGDAEIVTVTRPQIGSNKRVWITHENKKRDTAYLDNLYPIGAFDFIRQQCDRMNAYHKEIETLHKSIEALDRVGAPKPIEK